MNSCCFMTFLLLSHMSKPHQKLTWSYSQLRNWIISSSHKSIIALPKNKWNVLNLNPAFPLGCVFWSKLLLSFLALCMVIAMSVFTKDYRDGKIKYYNYKDTTSIDDFKLGWSFDLGWLGCILLTVDLFITCLLGYIYWRSSFQNNAGEKTGLVDGL